MIKLLIIADDLTGALDTGVQFSKKGIPALVTTELQPDRVPEDKRMQVLVIDTESRHMAPEEAAARVETAVSAAKAMGIRFIYKKTDSTLRGNIGAELGAVLKASGGNRLVFVPAYPKSGRTTVGGCQYVNGIPLHETAFARDPLNPIDDSYIPHIIGMQTNIPVFTIPSGTPADVPSGVSSDVSTSGDPENPKEPAALSGSAQGIFLYDAQKDADLQEIGRIVKRDRGLGLTAGCAGFAEYLPGLLGLEPMPMASHRRASGMMVISGSVNETSLKQINYAEKAGIPGIALAPREILEEGHFDTVEGVNRLNEIISALQAHKNLIIKTIEERGQMDSYVRFGRGCGLEGEKLHLAIAAGMGKLVDKILHRVAPGTLVIFGGDTALGIMEAIGCSGILPGDEIVSGVAVSEVVGGKYGTSMVTKAGGFGEEDVLMTIKEYLQEE